MPTLQEIPVRPLRRNVKLERKPELDGLRGVFLVCMTLVHLPTRISHYATQPIGFVSAAEGFVSLSAMLVARLYIRKAAEDPSALRIKLWKRALLIYAYHVVLLTLVFTLATACVATASGMAIVKWFSFYLAHPFTSVAGSLLLIYSPRFLDILPMYIFFLLLTPFALSFAARRGWKPLLAGSGLIWLVAQFGLRTWVHDAVVGITHLQIPIAETGLFNPFAWQAIWLFGLWIGAESVTGEAPFRKLPGYVYPIAAVICLFFLAVRHHWVGPNLTSESLGIAVEKWQVGWVRVINLVAFSCVLYWVRNPVKRLVTIEPFLTLGKASLHVFCAHIVFVFAGIALLFGEARQLHGVYAVAIVAATFTGLILVAYNETRRKHPRAAVATE